MGPEPKRRAVSTMQELGLLAARLEAIGGTLDRIAARANRHALETLLSGIANDELAALTKRTAATGAELRELALLVQKAAEQIALAICAAEAEGI